jgi:hypothetical protein
VNAELQSIAPKDLSKILYTARRDRVGTHRPRLDHFTAAAEDPVAFLMIVHFRIVLNSAATSEYRIILWQIRVSFWGYGRNVSGDLSA